MASDKNWIQGAIKRPGALRQWLGVPAGKKISVSLLRRLLHAARYKGRVITPLRRRQIQLAITLNKLRKNK